MNCVFSSELFGENGCEEVGIYYAVVIVVVNGRHFEYGDEAANFAHTINDGVLFAERSPFTNLGEVEISVVLVLGRLGGVLNLDVVVASYEVNVDAEHVGRHGVVVLTCCKCIFVGCELEGSFEGVFVCSAFVNGVLCTTFLAVLHSHVDSHFVNACFCNGYLNYEVLALTFGAVPVTDAAEFCGRNVRGRHFLDVVACPNVNAISELFGENGSEEVGLVYAVTVVIVNRSVFEYGDEATNFTHTINDGVLYARLVGSIGSLSGGFYGSLGSGFYGSFGSGFYGSLGSGFYGSFGSGLCGSLSSGLCRSFSSGLCRSLSGGLCRGGCCRSSFCGSGVLFSRLVTCNNRQHHNDGKSQSKDASNVLVFHLENLHFKFGAGLHGNIIS